MSKAYTFCILSGKIIAFVILQPVICITLILACHSSQKRNSMSNGIYHTGFNIYIKPTYIVTMPELTGLSGLRSSKQKTNESNLSDNSHKGHLSKKSMSKLRNAINWLISSAKYKRVYSKADDKNFWFKVNFVTLTVPPQHGNCVDEKTFKKVLHAWLMYASKYFYLKNYVWKIETHEDGRLHIHLCTDTFLHYRKLRKSWNGTLAYNGLLDKHFQQFGNHDPNSTDVHSVRKVNDVAAYLATYMAKKSTLPAEFKGRIWSCNRELSHTNQCTINVDVHEMGSVMRSLAHNQIRYSNLESPPDALGQRKKIGEIFFVNTDIWSRIIKGKIKDAYDTHRFYIRSGSASPPLDYLSVDKFSEKTIAEYVEKSKPTNQIIPCKTENFIRKIGQMKFDLPF